VLPGAASVTGLELAVALTRKAVDGAGPPPRGLETRLELLELTQQDQVPVAPRLALTVLHLPDYISSLRTTLDRHGSVSSDSR
jgi:hypothetical protein